MMANQLAVNRKKVTIRNALQKKHNGISMKERLEREGRDEGKTDRSGHHEND